MKIYEIKSVCFVRILNIYCSIYNNVELIEIIYIGPGLKYV